jgi:hypothetical protein
MRYIGQNFMADVPSSAMPAITEMMVAGVDANRAMPLMKGAASRTKPRTMRKTRSIVPTFVVISLSPIKDIFDVDLWLEIFGDNVTITQVFYMLWSASCFRCTVSSKLTRPRACSIHPRRWNY